MESRREERSQELQELQGNEKPEEFARERFYRLFHYHYQKTTTINTATTLRQAKASVTL